MPTSDDRFQECRMLDGNDPIGHADMIAETCYGDHHVDGEDNEIAEDDDHVSI